MSLQNVDDNDVLFITQPNQHLSLTDYHGGLVLTTLMAQDADEGQGVSYIIDSNDYFSIDSGGQLILKNDISGYHNYSLVVRALATTGDGPAVDNSRAGHSALLSLVVDAWHDEDARWTSNQPPSLLPVFTTDIGHSIAVVQATDSNIGQSVHYRFINAATAGVKNITAYAHAVDANGNIIIDGGFTGVWKKSIDGVFTQLATIQQLGSGYVYHHSLDANGNLIVSAWSGGLWQITKKSDGSYNAPTLLADSSALGMGRVYYHSFDSDGNIVAAADTGGVWLIKKKNGGGYNPPMQLATAAQLGGGNAVYETIDANGNIIVDSYSTGIFTIIKKADGSYDVPRQLFDSASLGAGFVYYHTVDAAGNLIIDAQNGGVWTVTKKTDGTFGYNAPSLLFTTQQLGPALYHTIDAAGNIIFDSNASGVWQATKNEAGGYNAPVQIVSSAQLGGGAAWHHTVDAAGNLIVDASTGGIYQLQKMANGSYGNITRVDNIDFATGDHYFSINANGVLSINPAATDIISGITPEKYTLIVSAYSVDNIDRQEIGQTLLQTIVVNVKSVAPQFVSAPFQAILSENSTAGMVFASFIAVNPHAQPVSYQLSGSDQNYFSINQSGGLILVSGLDYESGHAALYTVSVRATAEGVSNSRDFVLTLLNKDDNPTRWLSMSSTIMVGENNNLGAVMGSFLANDRDGQNISYSMEGADSTLFYINNLTGVLSLRSMLDFEDRTHA
ncbi:MAG: hypothetical protein ORN57_05645, partial [Alphaproteobacteria bacterium]|nr:hypothetical protein [Alphaproteobacteria bacterium]